MLVWLDADYLTGLSDGDAVTTWTDRSGNGNDCTQSTAAHKPLYKTAIIGGKPVLRFDGGDDYMQSAAGVLGTVTQLSVFVVAKYLTNAANKVICAASSGTYGGAPNDWWLIRQVDSPIKNTVRLADGLTAKEITNGNSDLLTHIFEMIWTGGATLINGIDGADQSTSSAGATSLALTDELDIAALDAAGSILQNAHVDIAEILIYDSANISRSTVRAYFKGKYGL